MNGFLIKHQVDVSRALAVLALATALEETVKMLQEWIAGNVTLNLGILLALVVGFGLWNRRPWSRKIVIVCSWLALGLLVGSTIWVLVDMHIGGRAAADASPLQTIGTFLIYLPILWILLLVAHSPRFREEVSGASMQEAVTE